MTVTFLLKLPKTDGYGRCLKTVLVFTERITLTFTKIIESNRLLVSFMFLMNGRNNYRDRLTSGDLMQIKFENIVTIPGAKQF